MWKKSIMYNDFMSPSHYEIRNKQWFGEMGASMARFGCSPTWWNFSKLLFLAVTGDKNTSDF
jgi:hypothetical protein